MFYNNSKNSALEDVTGISRRTPAKKPGKLSGYTQEKTAEIRELIKDLFSIS
jgi:ABC-type lipoprotein export system ATPase subunit